MPKFRDAQNYSQPKSGSAVAIEVVIATIVISFVSVLLYMQATGAELFGVWW